MVLAASCQMESFFAEPALSAAEVPRMTPPILITVAESALIDRFAGRLRRNRCLRRRDQFNH